MVLTHSPREQGLCSWNLSFTSFPWNAWLSSEWQKMNRKTGYQAQICILMYFVTWCHWTSELSCKRRKPTEYVKVLLSIIILCFTSSHVIKPVCILQMKLLLIPECHNFKIFPIVIFSLCSVSFSQIIQIATVLPAATVAVNLVWWSLMFNWLIHYHEGCLTLNKCLCKVV